MLIVLGLNNGISIYFIMMNLPQHVNPRYDALASLMMSGFLGVLCSVSPFIAGHWLVKEGTEEEFSRYLWIIVSACQISFVCGLLAYSLKVPMSDRFTYSK